jgi:hypothetical protein
MLMILSDMAHLSAFKSKGRLEYTLLSNKPTEKSQVLLGLANEVAMAHH